MCCQWSHPEGSCASTHTGWMCYAHIECYAQDKWIGKTRPRPCTCTTHATVWDTWSTLSHIVDCQKHLPPTPQWEELLPYQAVEDVWKHTGLPYCVKQRPLWCHHCQNFAASCLHTAALEQKCLNCACTRALYIAAKNWCAISPCMKARCISVRKHDVWWMKVIASSKSSFSHEHGCWLSILTAVVSNSARLSHA